MNINFIPDWVYWLVIAALAAVVGVQQIRVADRDVELAQAQTARSNETAAREKVARDATANIASLQAQHAHDQQLTENGYASKIQKLENDKRAGDALTGRLRGKLATFAASGRAPGETDAVALERAADRLGIVAGLLSESVDLVAESRSVVERRDLEVGRLLDQIKLDRAACSAPI